ncbi:MAG: porin family protein [Salibacteraceae bacterium]
MNFTKYLILSVLLCTGTIASAQINLGLKFGANYNVNGFDSDSLKLSFDNAVTFQGGGLVRVKIKKIHLQAEGLFSARKGEVFTTGSSGAKTKINFYTFDLPLIIGYKLMDLKVVKVRLNAGLVPSFNVANTGDLQDAGYEDAFYSAMGGVSVDIPFFLFDIRYQGAIGDYYQLQNVNHNTTLQNSMVTLSAAWKIL